jgi:hypothetical protein
MNDIPATIFIGLGAVVAAIITGLITFINLVIAKDQKTSEFRQEWINSLRSDVSNYLGYFAQIHAIWLHNQYTNESMEQFAKSAAESLQKLHSLFTQISLRLNPDEHSDFILCLKTLDDLAADANGLSQHKKIKELHTKITSHSQKILKQEWTRVKTGEPAYRKIKRHLKIGTSICFIIVLSLVIIA